MDEKSKEPLQEIPEGAESTEEEAPEKTPFRRKIFDMVEEGDWSKGRDSYDVFMIIMILLSLVPLMFHEDKSILVVLDHVTVVVFIIDYLMRWMTADYKFGSRSFISFLVYPFTPMAIIDLVSILPSLILISKSFKALRIIRMLKALRAFRALRIFRYSKGVLMIIEVLKSSKNSLITVAGIVVGYIMVCALIIFNVEPESFDTFFEAIYWATVSLTTIGYGDIYPVTFLGRLITMVSLVFGIAVIALPAGIVTAEFMHELQKQDADKNEKQDRPAREERESTEEKGIDHENM